MAVLNLDSLDDAIIVDSCPGFTGGVRSYGPPDQLQPVEAAELINIDTRDGTATTRRGASLLGSSLAGQIQGLFWFDRVAGEYLVAAVAGGLKKFDESSWSSCSSYAATDSTRQICMAQLIDTLYIADGIKHLFSWDDTTLADLGTGAGKPPIGSIVISALNRLWMAGIPSVPDAIYVSAFLDGSSFDSTYGTIRIGGGEGDPITGLAEMDDFQVAVFKRNSVYIVKADPVATFGGGLAPLSNAIVTKISDTIGCVSHRSIARVGPDVWFLSDAGVFSIGRVIAQTQREVKQAASLPVQDIVERIPMATAANAAGFYWNNRYLLSVPLDDETLPSTVLVYNTQRQSWSGTWTGWGPLCWALSKAAGQERLNFGRVDGQVWRWLDFLAAGEEVADSFRDAGAAVPSSATTRAMIFGDAVCPKSALSVQAEFFGSEAVCSCSAILDENEPMALATDFSTDPGKLLLPFTLPAILPGNGIKRRAFGAQQLDQFRAMQIRVSAAQDKMALRAVICSGFADTIQLEIP